MDITRLVNTIYDFLVQFVPLFQVIWTIALLVSIALFALAFLLRKNPDRKKAPWIVGSVGLLMFISSGTQLLFSLI